MSQCAIGHQVSYRTAALGQFYPARVLAVRSNGTLDIEIIAPSPVTLTERPWWEGEPQHCPLRACTHAGLIGSIGSQRGPKESRPTRKRSP